MRNCIIVTSIVEISDAPLDWSAVRSIYSHQQRFEQTLETIESIRKHLPDTEIILAECSPPSSYMDELQKRVDVFINTYPNDLIRNGFHKGACEAQLLLYVFDRVDLSVYDNIFKMTGRYVLLDKFDRNAWMNDMTTICTTYMYAPETNLFLSMHTFFYKITRRDLDVFLKTLQMITEKNQPWSAIEIDIYNALINNPLQTIDTIGIEVRWSSFNSIAYF